MAYVGVKVRGSLTPSLPPSLPPSHVLRYTALSHSLFLPSLPPFLPQDTDILPYALFTNMMALLGIIVYREAEPIQPQPQVRKEGREGGREGRREEGRKGIMSREC